MDERSETIGGSPNASEANGVSDRRPDGPRRDERPRPVRSETNSRPGSDSRPHTTDRDTAAPAGAPHLQVRPAVPDDALPVFALHVASIRALGPEAYDPDQVRAWARKDHGPDAYPIEEDDHHFVVAERGEEIAGFGDLVPDSEEVDADADVRAVYVHPDHVGRGVGAAILAELEGYARGAGVASIGITASLNAVGFYERAGYERLREDAYDTGGTELDVVVLRKEL